MLGLNASFTSFRLLVPILLLAAAAPGALHAQALAQAAVATQRYGVAVEAGRSLLGRVMEESGIPGVSVAILVDGRVEWSEGLGYADLENRVPATALTRFRIGSVSKPVTAAALGLLHQEGRLDLDAPVQRYVPSFPQKRWPISTRQVAGHLAGIRHYRGSEMLSNRRYGSVTESLGIFAGDSLLHQPGTEYLYSSYGWNLISAVVEGAAGEDFLGYMRTSVFEPLGLRSIVAEHTDSIIPYRASFYDRDDGRVVNAEFVDNSYKWAGGGFVSNTEDLVRFAWAHLQGELLDPATVQLLFAPQRTSAGEDTSYGIGWRSGTDDAGRAWIGHTGSSTGGRAVLLMYPRERMAIAVLANLGSAPLTPQLAQRLAAPFLNAGAGR